MGIGITEATGISLTLEVAAFLEKHREEKFTPREIAIWFSKTYPHYCHERQRRSRAIVVPLDSDMSLLQGIVRDIYGRRPVLKKNHRIKITNDKPMKFYYT